MWARCPRWPAMTLQAVRANCSSCGLAGGPAALMEAVTQVNNCCQNVRHGSEIVERDWILSTPGQAPKAPCARFVQS